MSIRIHRAAFAACIMTTFLARSAWAQSVKLPAPDKDGWIRLFRGDNTADFYARTATDINKDLAFPNGTFKTRGDTIETTGSPTGHLAFKQVFSHYQFRMEIMLPAQTNCGLLLHVRDEEDKMGNFPRSVEFQGDPNQGMGELWVISSVNVDVKVKPGATTHTYDPEGTKASHPSSTSGRVCHQSENRFKGYGQWNLLEAVVRGSDSISHYVNGGRVMQYTNLRIQNDLKRPLNSGRIAVQSEGKPAFYRNLAIRLLPGDPLYQTTYVAFRERFAIRPRAVQGLTGMEWVDLRGRLLILREAPPTTPKNAFALTIRQQNSGKASPSVAPSVGAP